MTTPQEYPHPPFEEQTLDWPGDESKLRPRPEYRGVEYKPAAKLLDCVALVTGGDSGIGRAVAVHYAREGADVGLVYTEAEQGDAEETAAEIRKHGRKALLLPGDVQDFDFCRHAVERTVDELGRLDILVNNAAYQQHCDRPEDVSLEQWDTTFKTNIYGYFHMVKAALQHLGEGSSIINTGSVTGLEGAGKLLDYATTKGAIHAFTKSLAQALVDRGIRVNCVAPGPVWTPLNPAERSAQEVATFGEHVPYGRPAQPEEIAPAYVFLASNADSSYLTGEVIALLGGSTHAG